MTTTARPEPLAIDELLAKKKAEAEAEAKPKFLTKAERQALAIQKREEEVARQRAAQKKIEEKREAFAREAKKAESSGRDRDREHERMRDRDRRDDRRDHGRDHGREHGRDHGRDRGDRDRRRRSRSRSRSPRRRSRSPRGESTRDREQGKDSEKAADAIKQRYLGAQKEKRKRGRRLHERKFIFDWDTTEDTSNDYDKLYRDRHEVQFFGRGLIAGVDVGAQKKVKSEFYLKHMEERRTHEEQDKEDMRQEQLRKKQKKEEWDDRHWKQKPLDEMQDRDWRIFREDFNIVIKGGKLPKPIRYWEEAGLPKEVVDVIYKVGYKKPPNLPVLGAHTDSTPGHPYRPSEPRHYRRSRNRIW
ncbi:hypothetical protein L596_017275 [Steinernema carpocapsae]|uniref:PRP28/DDX23-like helical domain-containing protein n=1 Tax=Steinernema carpocapsae TaxID=34508 RepID=A0A4U5N168_STECR|nr:hypothetical protein L596_017275 [Steinernema carpocapsae]